MATYNTTGHTMCDLHECTNVATFHVVSDANDKAFNMCRECLLDWSSFVTVVTTIPTFSNLDY